MIIFEGPDGSGKSTLVQHMGCERRSLKAMRNGVGMDGSGWAAQGEAPLAAYQRKALGALKDEKRDPSKPVQPKPIAYDRFHLSEHVYGPLLRQMQCVPEREMWEIKRWLASMRIPVILCLPPLDVTLANVRTPGRERPSYQTDDFLIASYNGFAALREFADVVFDYTTQPMPRRL